MCWNLYLGIEISSKTRPSEFWYKIDFVEIVPLMDTHEIGVLKMIRKKRKKIDQSNGEE